jgi:hypothetical protein
MFEIAGGIILAVMFFWLLPLIIAGGVAVIAIGAVVLVGVLLYSHMTETLQGLGWLLVLAVSFGSPVLLYTLAIKRFPSYQAVIDGKEPYTSMKSVPIRIAVTGATAVGGVVMAFSAMYYLGSLIDSSWR